jgi:uncharacterized repeat protein (TIGR04076 family)
MFQVKATVISFAGDEKKYPCHFGYSIGDEILYDGEKFVGRICLQVLPLLNKYVMPLASAGPRYIDPIHYYPFWNAPSSARDSSLKKYDGVGMKIQKISTAGGSARNAQLFGWPPYDKRDVGLEITAKCDDARTGVTFKFEASDLMDKGDAIPYFRKQMVILDHVVRNPGIAVDGIMASLPKVHVEEIYPGLYPALFDVLFEELEAIGFLATRNDRAFATKKGELRLNSFKADIPPEDRVAMGLE